MGSFGLPVYTEGRKMVTLGFFILTIAYNTFYLHCQVMGQGNIRIDVWLRYNYYGSSHPSSSYEWESQT